MCPQADCVLFGAGCAGDIGQWHGQFMTGAPVSRQEREEGNTRELPKHTDGLWWADHETFKNNLETYWHIDLDPGESTNKLASQIIAVLSILSIESAGLLGLRSSCHGGMLARQRCDQKLRSFSSLQSLCSKCPVEPFRSYWRTSTTLQPSCSKFMKCIKWTKCIRCRDESPCQMCQDQAQPRWLLTFGVSTSWIRRRDPRGFQGVAIPKGGEFTPMCLFNAINTLSSHHVRNVGMSPAGSLSFLPHTVGLSSVLPSVFANLQGHGLHHLCPGNLRPGRTRRNPAVLPSRIVWPIMTYPSISTEASWRLLHDIIPSQRFPT